MTFICNEIDKLETSMTKEQYKEFMKSNGFGYPGGQESETGDAREEFTSS